MNFELTTEQLEHFDQDGFVLVDKLVSQDTVIALRDCYDKLFTGQFETGVTPDEVNWQEGTGDPSLTRQICNGWKANRTIASVVMREDLGKAIAKLGGWPGTRLMVDNVLWKPPGTRPLAYHQDNAYLDWFSPTELLSCWIALDDTSAEGGTMELVRGSHRWHRTKPEGEFHGPKDYRKYMQRAAAKEHAEPEIVYVEVSAGGGSFHHGWTWHGSGDNHATAPRRALVLHAMRSDTHYVPDALSLGTGSIYSRYKHLADNIIDENYFPVIWREDGYRTAGIDTFLSGG